jgi:isopenicillin N synthase-like dioxygenase
VKSVIPQFFALPEAEKEKLSFLNSPHFLGYNALDSEATTSKTDLCEQFEFSNDLEEERTDPLSFQRLQGPSQ